MRSIKQGDAIAILGASSHIARDFILNADQFLKSDLRLYARNPEKVDTFLSKNGLGGRWPVLSLASFGNSKYSAIINFIGVGDPAQAQAMGRKILDVTLQFDQLVAAYLERYPEARYIFISSGAVYGGEYSRPVDANTNAVVPINRLETTDFYGVAKLCAEVRHRASTQHSILDIRIFNYISRSLDFRSKFLIMEMINAIRENRVFRTDSRPLARDFLHPIDFGQLIAKCLAAPAATNTAVDAFSLAPISKHDLVILMASEFGMRFEFSSYVDAVNATGAKSIYYSENKNAEKYGYRPLHSSASGIRQEVSAILGL